MFIGLLVSTFIYGQTTLPTNWGFSTTTLPSGWTDSPSSSNNYYTASGNPAPAFKFGSTGTSLTINVASAPGLMTFDIAGNSFSGAGTFEVQESTDGTTYTTNKVFNSANLSSDGSYVNEQVTLSANSRFIKFIYVLKTAGNVGLDNVNINAAPVTHQQLQVNVNNNAIVNNNTVFTGANVGSTTVLPFDILNTGTTDPLNVSNISISGTDAAEFALSTTPTYPLVIGGSSSQSIGLEFTPTAAGTRSATVTVTSNDLDNPIFSFDLVGYGDNLATEPSTQPTNLTFSNVKTYRMKATFSGSSAEGYLVLRKNGAAITESPLDGVSYGPGDMIGSAKVVGTFTSTSFVPNDIVANSDYYFAVFAYNGNNQYINYLNSNPLTGNQMTPQNMIPSGEYSSINTANPSLIDDLHDLISPHFQQYYSNYAARLIEAFYQRDTINGLKVLTGSYTGNSYTYTSPFNFASSGLSREHTYAYSWMPLTDQNANYYSDYHNLFPVNQNDANAIRSNYPFGIVVSDTLQAHGNSYFGKNAQGKWVYEPRDEQKGAAARALFYMCTRYTENGTVWKLPAYISQTITYGQDQTILKLWNQQYPPSKLEIARNDYLDSLQQNRNPFIDHPEYACFIDFSNMTYHVNGCQDLTVKEKDLSKALSIYPNPSSSSITISTEGFEIKGYRINDLQGRLYKDVTLDDHQMSKQINLTSLAKGTYMITVTTSNGEIAKKLVVE